MFCNFKIIISNVNLYLSFSSFAQTHKHTHTHTHTGKGLNSAPYSQLSNDLKSGSISEFRYEDLDLGGSFDGEGGFGMGNLRGSESDLVGIGAVHSQWQLTRYAQ
jgi:hypothetical protein